MIKALLKGNVLLRRLDSYFLLGGTEILAKKHDCLDAKKLADEMPQKY